ncbi:hypothetical protein Tco_1205335 [Tanacetum coccineum]
MCQLLHNSISKRNIVVDLGYSAAFIPLLVLLLLRFSVLLLKKVQTDSVNILTIQLDWCGYLLWPTLVFSTRAFDALTKLPKCTCEVKCSCDACKELGLHQQLMKLMQFLMGVDDCYQSVRSSLLTRDPLPEVSDAYNVVSKERQFNNNNNFTRGSACNVNRGPNPNLNCKYYGKIGHTIDRYFEIVGFHQGDDKDTGLVRNEERSDRLHLK